MIFPRKWKCWFPYIPRLPFLCKWESSFHLWPACDTNLHQCSADFHLGSFMLFLPVLLSHVILLISMSWPSLRFLLKTFLLQCLWDLAMVRQLLLCLWLFMLVLPQCSYVCPLCLYPCFVCIHILFSSASAVPSELVMPLHSLQHGVGLVYT